MIAAALLLTTASCAAAVTTTPSPAPGPTLVAVPGASGTLLAPPDLAPDRRQAWLDRIELATRRLARAGLEPLDDEWDGRLVVELPATSKDYALLAGPDSADAAAITHCPQDGPRITINPAVAGEDPDYLDTLLLHEGVHIATGSSCAGRAPQWVEEGLAELVACEHDADCLAASEQWVVHSLAEHGRPLTLPADSDFRGSSAEVSAAYALARQAVASAVARLGKPATMALLDTYYRDVADAERTRQLTQWYLADLDRVSASAPR